MAATYYMAGELHGRASLSTRLHSHVIWRLLRSRCRPLDSLNRPCVRGPIYFLPTAVSHPLTRMLCSVRCSVHVLFPSWRRCARRSGQRRRR